MSLPHEYFSKESGVCATVALNEYDVYFCYQPIVSFPAGKVVSYEALVRGGNHENATVFFQQLSDAEFTRFDVDSKYIAIADYVKTGATRDLSLNFSTKTLTRFADLPSMLDDMLRSLGISVNSVIIEITETDAIEDIDKFLNTIERLRALGFRIAIDDFGAGFSGLSLLTHCVPDIIKIDSSLVLHVSADKVKQSIVTAIRMIAADCGIVVVAEGVEHQQDLLWLLDAKVDLFQGYLFAKPTAQPSKSEAWARLGLR
ncbi:MAG: EAL domain-containing protein [Rhodoferax sp.]|nr:EAL domain-containing protein [Rhodoferax sp.]